MIKYASLHRFLLADPERPVTLAFDQVTVLTDGLPRSAYDWRAWWANERADTHGHARAWLDAGRTVTSVDLVNESVTFSKQAEAAAA